MIKKNLWRLMAILMVAMLSVGFVSCGDDDDEDGPSGSSLTGTWKETYYQETEYKLTDGNWVKTDEDEESYPENEASMGIIFQSDGKMKTVSDLKADGSYSHVEGEMKYKVQNDHLYLYYEDDDVSDWEDVGKISVSGSTFELTWDEMDGNFRYVGKDVFKKVK